MLVVTQQFLNLLQDGWSAGNLNASSLRLYQNNYIPTRHSILSDFVECTFTNYSREVLATPWGRQFFNASGGVERMDLHGVTSTPATVPNIVYGFYLVSTVVADMILLAGRFTIPWPVIIGPRTQLLYLPVIFLENKPS